MEIFIFLQGQLEFKVCCAAVTAPSFRKELQLAGTCLHFHFSKAGRREHGCTSLQAQEWIRRQRFLTPFAVNLVFGNGAIAFHFNPRFDKASPVVVCNTHRYWWWGTEERNSSMPFRQDDDFKMAINVTDNCYQVSVNGQHFLEYRHRIPLQKVCSLEIRGDEKLKIASICVLNCMEIIKKGGYCLVSMDEQAPECCSPPGKVDQPEIEGDSEISNVQK
uniref:Galectin n=1 Tax=Sphenodon punctatus TaxID=8508 RepID=A0A8D0H1R1_SPHPU